MKTAVVRLLTAAVLVALCVLAAARTFPDAARTFQVRDASAQDIDPFPQPINIKDDVVRVNLA
ncbi:MAG TPA: hypothetical protein VGJ52_07990, partial [Vicinamibacterales bacterium]